MCVDLVVVVGFPGHDGFLFEIECCRRGLRSPLESGGIPGIVRCGLAVTHRPEEVDHRQEITDAEDGCTGGREYVEHLKLGRILVHAPRHAQVAENELREEGQIESEEYDERGQAGPT